MPDGVPEVRVVGGRVVAAPGVGPVPMVWLPRDEQVITRRWAGWQPQHGRAAPSSNLDTSYYYWCPCYGHEWAAPCST